MAGEAAAVSPSTVHVAISRYVPTPKNLQVCTNTISPGTNNMLLSISRHQKHTTFGFFLFGQFDFFSLLEKLREDVATAPFQPGTPLEVKCLLFLFQNIQYLPRRWLNIICSFFNIFNTALEGGWNKQRLVRGRSCNNGHQQGGTAKWKLLQLFCCLVTATGWHQVSFN